LETKLIYSVIVLRDSIDQEINVGFGNTRLALRYKYKNKNKDEN